MWAALALTTVLNLAPAQAGVLSIKNVRVTYGVLGQARKEAKVLPGDIAVVSFDIHGLTVKANGDVLYATGFELTKKGKDKAELKQDMEDKKAVNNLGGDVLPTMTFAAFGLDTVPGTYTIKVTVKDRGAMPTREVVLSKDIEVGKPEFGFVRVRFTSASNEPAPAVAVPGQALLLRYALVGFGFDKKDKLPDITVEMQVLDGAGKATTQSAKARVQPAIKEDTPFIEFLPIPLQLNRAGKFKVRLVAKCAVSSKSAEQVLDLEVLDR